MTTATTGPEATVDPRLLGGLSADAWDRIAGPCFFSIAACLNLCDMHGGADSGAVVHFTDGQPAAAVPFAEITEPPFPLYRWNEQLAQRGLPTVPSGGLLVGPRRGYRTDFLVRPGADRTSSVAALVEQLRDRATDACVAMYVTTSDARALLAAGITAQPVLLDADAWIHVPAGGWDDWLRALPQGRRNSIRRELRQFREAGYKVTRVSLADCYEQLPALAGATQARYGHDGPPSEWLGLFKLHIAAMGSAAQVALCTRGDDDPVGFCLYYVWEDTAYLRWAGFDYDRLAGAAEYFNLVYYSHVMDGPDLGVRWLHTGIKALEAKALRGAELRPLWLVDLGEDSVLARDCDAVRSHNARTYERLAADDRIRRALRDAGEWTAFS